MKKFLALVVASLFFSVNAEVTPFVLITVPKSGSHMIMKALYLFSGGEAIWHTHFPSFWLIPPEKGFLYTHFCLTPELEADYKALPTLKKVISIRDLRDVAISIVSQIKKSPWPGMDKELRDSFCRLPFHDQLLFVIDFEYDVHEVAEKAPNSNQASLIKIAQQAVEYAACPDNLVCRYESLVGPMGGGTEEEQIVTLTQIAKFIGADVLEENIIDIAHKLYGNEFNPFGKDGFKNFHSTFSKGKIGGWREVFTEEHKEAFKRKLGKELIALGYETDDNW